MRLTDRDLPYVINAADFRSVYALRPADVADFSASLQPAQSAYLAATSFSGRAQELVLLPGQDGIDCAVFGLGSNRSHHGFGDLPFRLPPGDWRLAEGDFDAESAALGFCLGAYRYTEFKPLARPAARLVVDGAHTGALRQAAAIWMGRDLINTPANLLGPSELADACEILARAYGASFERTTGPALDAAYPTIAAVGRGSDRAPVVAHLSWSGSTAASDAPLVSLCGKGVVFDSGGYDLKPAAGMLRMKKDMGGAAAVLALARILMAADLPIRLKIWLGCVENSVSGRAMRPLDVIRTRRGLTVEVGNTDAEGRLVLCDLLAEASDEDPALLVDCATLTGAARTALGPELPALFSNDDGWAQAQLDAGLALSDPSWRLPLWDGYASWLDSPIADLNNVSSTGHAGAVVAALFLDRFVKQGTPWMHFDTYAWNDSSRPARPEGGEVMAMRALAHAIQTRLVSSSQPSI